MYVRKYFGDKYGVRGSRFGHVFGRSKNHPKSIAIDQESLISRLGIIETPKNPHNYIKKQENPQKHVFAAFWTLLDPVLDPGDSALASWVDNYCWTRPKNFASENLYVRTSYKSQKS